MELDPSSSCRLTSWGSHWGQKSKLWEIKSGHQWVNTLERHLKRNSDSCFLARMVKGSLCTFFWHTMILFFDHFTTVKSFSSLSYFPLWFLHLCCPSWHPLFLHDLSTQSQPWSGGLKFVLFCFLHLFLLLSTLTPISGCCESEGAIKMETQSSQP